MVGQGLRTALVLGGADTLHKDLEHYDGPVDGVVACNDAGIEWAGQLDAWVSLHPRYWAIKGWIEKRAERGHPEALAYYAHESARPPVPSFVKETSYLFDGQGKSGSSGLFAAKVALVDLGFDMVVLCGIPLTISPHYFDAEPWRPAEQYRKHWLTVPQKYRAHMRSMSGWTRVLLGAP